MATKEQTRKFLYDLAWTGKVEFNNLKTITTFDDAYWKETMYFCAWFDKKLEWRCWDKDFTKKKYFVVDLDIRENIHNNENRIIDDEELVNISMKVISELNENWFGDFRYWVFSWNGIHLYYVWEELEIDNKTYSKGVEYIYRQIDSIIRENKVSCDPACKNISRITRLPWSINTRTKKRWDKVLRDLEPIECDFFIETDTVSENFWKLKEYASMLEKEEELEKKNEQYIRQIVSTVKKDEKIFDEINRIPAYEVAQFVWWVWYKDCGKDNCPLLEKEKNMWAYYWKPSNVIVNTGSSMIKNRHEKYFTTYRLVRDELLYWDVEATIKRFKDKYNIQVIPKWVIPPKKEYEIKGFVYGNKIFYPFDCMMSGELCVVVAKTNSWKTTFAMNMLQENKKIGKEWFYINLEFAIETVAKNRWLWMNWKSKKNLTDLAPLTEQEQLSLQDYVKKYLAKFKYYNNPKGETLEDLVDMIIKKNEEWYELFVLDSFSKIKWNSDSDNTRGKQNIATQTLQDLAQSLWICIVVLHHTNKAGDFEWSQKIMDDSNVFIVMWRDVSPMWTDMTKFTLTKDKFVNYTEIQACFEKWEYVPTF